MNVNDNLKSLIQTYFDNSMREIEQFHADLETKKLIKSIAKETADFMAAYSDEITHGIG